MVPEELLSYPAGYTSDPLLVLPEGVGVALFV